VVLIVCLLQMRVMYRDLKPENIMTDADGHLALKAFGLCKMFLPHETVIRLVKVIFREPWG
jgi:serine/threonine protein kinase